MYSTLNTYKRILTSTTAGIATTTTFRNSGEEVSSLGLGTGAYTVLLASITGEAAATKNCIYRNNNVLLNPSSPGTNRLAVTSEENGKDFRSYAIIDTSPGTGSNTYSNYIRTGASDIYYPNTTGSTSVSQPKGASILTAFNIKVGGGLLQAPVVTTVDTTFSGTSTSSTWADPSLSVTITPTSSTSKLVIIGNAVIGADLTVVQSLKLKLDRDGSDILVGTSAGSRTAVTSSTYCGTTTETFNIPIFYVVDSVSTSPTTIKALIGTGQSASKAVYLNRSHTDSDTASYSRGVSQLAVFEIEGV